MKKGVIGQQNNCKTLIEVHLTILCTSLYMYIWVYRGVPDHQLSTTHTIICEFLVAKIFRVV